MTKIQRTGECRQCGECCRNLGWLLVHADADTAEWIQARDPQIKIVPDEEVADYHWVTIPYLCVHLKEVGGGRYECDMHGSKPAQCKRYPESIDELKPGCGYAFRASDTDSL